MPNKIILDKDELIEKYINEGLSQKKVADYFNVSIDTVVRNLKEYNIESHKLGSWNESNIVKLNEIQKDYLYGAMLGDGCLSKAKKGKNAQFVYTSKSKQHVEFVSSPFIEYSYDSGIVKYDYFDKRTDKTYTRYQFRTITDKGFTDDYNLWYRDGIKHIPENLILNPIICLIWYIGDGGICNSSKNNSQSIKIATNCFEKHEQEEILLPQLKDFDARLCIASKNKNTKENQYAIYIPKNKMNDFLTYIGDCPFEDYIHKWNVKENFYPSYKDVYDEWESLYLSGIGYTKIAKMYNADNTTVLKHLRKVGIYQNFIGYKKYYKEWEEGYKNGETCSDIAKDYGCYTQTVSHHLKKVGIYKYIRKGVIQDGQE